MGIPQCADVTPQLYKLVASLLLGVIQSDVTTYKALLMECMDDLEQGCQTLGLWAGSVTRWPRPRPF